ncbi:MAG: hypothetical protein ACXWC4_21860 [Telluria sp.]
MPQPQDHNGSRYIVRAAGDSAPLQSFIDGLPGEPAIRLVQAIGPAAQAHTVVIQTDAATAQALAHRFSHTNQLMIEPDRPLSMFGHGPA